MDLPEVKDLIKSLLRAANGCCTIQELLIEFEEETGFELPYFNFYNCRDFLLTLTDIVKIFNSPFGEWITLINPNRPRTYRAYIRGRFRTSIPENERPDFSTRDIDLEGGFQQHDINLFIRAYQMGWITLNTWGDWEKVESRCGLEQDEIDADNIEFLFSNVDKDDLEELTERRTSIRRFLARIDFVQVPTGYPPYARAINYSVPYTCASDEFQKDLKHMMTIHLDPIPLDKLPEIYFSFFSQELTYKDHGYRTMLEMVKSLKHIFRCVRLKKNDWLIIDAGRAPDKDEEEIYIWAFRNLPKDIINCIINLLETHCERTSQPGIPIDNFLALYYKKYRKKLDFTRYGFPDFRSLLSKLNGKILKVERFGRDVFIKPLIEKSNLKKRTIFNLNPGDDAFSELFPTECIGYGTKYLEMKPEACFNLGRHTKVNTTHIYTPHQFYLQLKKYEEYFFDLMSRMQYFYWYQENRCRMPAAAIRPNQICVALYAYEEVKRRWYRAIIKKVLDGNYVLLYFVDFGAEVKLDIEYIRFLHRKFYSVPQQAFFARIYNIRSLVENKWPLSVCQDFYNILYPWEARFRLTEYDRKAKILLGELYVQRPDGLTSVGDILTRQVKAARKSNYDEPYDGEEYPEPCRELVPVVRQTVERRGLQVSDLEPSDDYFGTPDESSDSSLYGPELMQVIFDRELDEDNPGRVNSVRARVYEQFWSD